MGDPQGMMGADPAQLRVLAHQMKNAANQLQGIAKTLTQHLGQAAWAGADADAMRQDWSAKYRASIRNAELALHDAAKTLVTQADQQEQASADQGSTAGRVGFDGQDRARSFGPDDLMRHLESAYNQLRWLGSVTLADNIDEFRGRTWKTWNKVSQVLPDGSPRELVHSTWIDGLRDMGEATGHYLTGFSLVNHAYKGLAAALEGGDYATWAVGNEVAASGADLLKTSKAGYAYGIALAAVTEASEQIQAVFDADGFSREGWDAFTSGLADPEVVKASLQDTAAYIPQLLGDVFL